MNSLRRTTSTAIICCTRHGPTCCAGLDSESRRPRTIVGRSNWPRTKANGGIWSEGSDKCSHRERKGFGLERSQKAHQRATSRSWACRERRRELRPGPPQCYKNETHRSNGPPVNRVEIYLL